MKIKQFINKEPAKKVTGKDLINNYLKTVIRSSIIILAFLMQRYVFPIKNIWSIIILVLIGFVINFLFNKYDRIIISTVKT